MKLQLLSPIVKIEKINGVPHRNEMGRGLDYVEMTHGPLRRTDEKAQFGQMLI